MPLILNFFSMIRQRMRRITRSEMMPMVWIGILLIGIGTVTYASLEDWSWLDALYATIITITTVGYGDLSPQSVPGRIFAIFFTVIAIGLGGYAITNLAAVTVEGRARKIEKKHKRRRMKAIDTMQNHFIICGADMVRIPSVISGVEMATHIMHPEIGRWWYSRVGQGQTSGIPLSQNNLDAESLWIGQTPGQIYKSEQKMILSVKRGDKHISPPPHDLMLEDGDVLIIMSS